MICIACFVIIKKDYGDEYLILIVSMLLSFGLMMIYRLDENLGIKQLIWVAIGFVMFLFFTMCILKFTNGTDLPIYTYLFLLFCTLLH